MKYTDDTINEITESLRKGYGRVAACKVAGIDYQTFIDWMDAKIPTRFSDKKEARRISKIVFSEVVKNAEVEGRQTQRERAIAAVMNGMGKFWQAGAWWLERNYPDEYRNRSEVTGANGKDLNPQSQFDLSQLTDKELDRLAELQSKVRVSPSKAA